MGRKKYGRGLRLKMRGGVYHITGTLYGVQVRESTRTRDANEAQEVLGNRIREITAHALGRGRRRYTWQAAVVRYFESAKKKSIEEDRRYCRKLDPFLNGKFLDEIKMTTLAPFIEMELTPGVDEKGDETPGNSAATVNHALQVVRRILRLAAGEWEDEKGAPWIERAPVIHFLENKDARPPRPVTYEEQALIFSYLPDYLRSALTFKVNTGLREQDVCGLRWDYLRQIPETSVEVFVIPWDLIKNTDARVVFLNSIAQAVVQAQRGVHPEYVFPGPRGRLSRLNLRSYRRARERAGETMPGLETVRVHDFKHTLGARLRAAGVPEEDRKFLLGHRAGQTMTTHYSSPEIFRMLEYLERVVDPVKLKLVAGLNA